MTKLNNMCKVCGQTPCNCTSVTEAGVGNRMSDMSVGSPKIVYKNGRAVGEIGIDHNASPGNGPYYMKHYETNTSYSGYDTKKEALAELKHCVEQMNEQDVAEGLPKAQDGRYNPDGSKKQAWHKDPRWQQHAKDWEKDPKNIYGGVGKKKVDEQGVAEGYLNEFAQSGDNRPDADYEVYLLDPKALRNKKLDIMGDPMFKSDNLAHACTFIYKYWNSTKQPICVFQPKRGYFRDYYMDPAVNWMDEYGNAKGVAEESAAPTKYRATVEYGPTAADAHFVTVTASSTEEAEAKVQKWCEKKGVRNPMITINGADKPVDEGLGDIYKGVKRGLKGKPHPDEVAARHFGRVLGNANVGNKQEADKETKRFNKVQALNKGRKTLPDQLEETENGKERKRNALWAQITSYEKRARETTNDIKRDHLMKMADELRAKLPTTDEEKLDETLNDLAEVMGTELEEAPGAETLGHNQSTVASNLNSLDLDEGDKKPEQPKQPEADYGDDYQAMVSRVKKLAGMGPLKTVYDPAKRVYRNVPTAVQPKK